MADIHDDVRGKLGDVSGFEVGGKLGDVSGNETFEQVLDMVTGGQGKEILHCLEIRVNRLEHLLLAIARWLDLRIRNLKDRLVAAEGDLANHERRIAALEDRLRVAENHLREIPQPPKP